MRASAEGDEGYVSPGLTGEPPLELLHKVQDLALQYMKDVVRRGLTGEPSALVTKPAARAAKAKPRSHPPEKRQWLEPMAVCKAAVTSKTLLHRCATMGVPKVWVSDIARHFKIATAAGGGDSRHDTSPCGRKLTLDKYNDGAHDS